MTKPDVKPATPDSRAFYIFSSPQEDLFKKTFVWNKNDLSVFPFLKKKMLFLYLESDPQDYPSYAKPCQNYAKNTRVLNGFNIFGSSRTPMPLYYDILLGAVYRIYF